MGRAEGATHFCWSRLLGLCREQKTGASRVLLSTDAEEVCSDSCTTQREGATRSNEGAKKRGLDVRTRGGTVAEANERHQRRQSVRERSRERQRGSMETVAERLGEAVRSRRSMATLESPLAVVPEEDDVKCEACDACHECEAADPEVETFPKVEPPSPSTEIPWKEL